MGGIPHLSRTIEGNTLRRLETYLSENTDTPSSFLDDLSRSAGILGRTELKLSAGTQSALMSCANNNLESINFSELAQSIRREVSDATS